MLRFLVQKCLRAVTVLAGVTLLMFLLMHAIPGSPWSNFSTSARMLPNMVPDEALQRQLNRRFGLDLPWWRQYTRYLIGDVNPDGSWFCGAVCGNLGPSIQQRGRSVQDILFAPPLGLPLWKSRFGYSVRLVGLGALIAVGIGIPLGIASGAAPRAGLSHAISIGLAALISIPNFVLGLLGIVVLGSGLGLIRVLPDWNVPSHWLIPGLVLAVMPMASIARVTRAALMHVLNDAYVRTARAKGLTPARVMLVHVLRNALVPIITFLGPTLMELFAGLFIVENLYAFPGFGRQYWEAILALDYPMIMGLTLLYAAGMVLVNGLAEVAGERLDPRLRATRQAETP
jgi:oligopeptide transport system permease protein